MAWTARHLGMEPVGVLLPALRHDPGNVLAIDSPVYPEAILAHLIALRQPDRSCFLCHRSQPLKLGVVHRSSTRNSRRFATM